MAVTVYNDHETLSSEAADRILGVIQTTPHAVLCLAAGDTPRLTYRLLAEAVRRDRVDVDHCTFVALDEWVGIPPSDEGSCSHFLKTHLFGPLGIKDSQIHLFDALAEDPDAECLKMNAFIRNHGGIDLMVVGVGMNGHIGFNEPGVAEDLYAHVTPLDETTQRVGQKYFTNTTTLQKGITLGLRHVLESRELIVLASGQKKAAIMERALEGNITTDVPASLVRKHPNGMVMLDKEAASSLNMGK